MEERRAKDLAILAECLAPGYDWKLRVETVGAYVLRSILSPAAAHRTLTNGQLTALVLQQLGDPEPATSALKRPLSLFITSFGKSPEAQQYVTPGPEIWTTPRGGPRRKVRTRLWRAPASAAKPADLDHDRYCVACGRGRAPEST